MDKLKTVVTVKPFDDGHYIAFFSKGDKDIGFRLAMRGFDEDLRLLGYDCRMKVLDGKTGFLLPDTTDIDDVAFQAERYS